VQPVSLAAGVSAADSFAQKSAAGYLQQPNAHPWGSTATTIVITVRGRVPSLVPGLPISVSEVAEAPVEKFTIP
jgi:hypothetical protein